MDTRILKLGNCPIALNSEFALETERETKSFVCKDAKEDVKYTYIFKEVEHIPLPQDLPCIQWGQWWIYNPGKEEIHIRRADDTGIPYMRYERIDEKEFQITYLAAIRPHLGINRFTLSFMALERRMLEQQGLILHCSFVEYRGYGILFSAPSGTGKSTQADLWAKYRDCRIINGDRALIQKQKDSFVACGWPVCGSSQISENTCVPIRAILQLTQGKKNQILEEAKAERAKKLIPEVTINRWNTAIYMQALDLVEQLVEEIPIFRYTCNISEEAVTCLDTFLFPEGKEDGA